MIRLAEPSQYDRLAGICHTHPLYGNLILVNWECCREDWRFCNIWTGEDQRGQVRFALCRTGNFYRLAGKDLPDSPIDTDELAEFLRLQPPGDIQGNGQVMGRLNRILKKEPYSSITMVYGGEPDRSAVPDEEGFSLIRPCESLFHLHSMVCQGYDYFREHVPAEGWVFSLFTQQRKGCARAYELVLNGKPVCSGVLTAAPGSPDATIGTVCTLPTHQKQGLASVMVRYLCREAFRMGRTVSLDCGDESLAEFYGPLGFVVADHWTVLESAAD